MGLLKWMAGIITPVHKDTPEPEAPKQTPSLEMFTVKQLREVAKSRGLTGYTALKKADLVALLQHAE